MRAGGRGAQGKGEKEKAPSDDKRHVKHMHRLQNQLTQNVAFSLRGCLFLHSWRDFSCFDTKKKKKSTAYHGYI